jgi:hypothetical protein
MERKIQKIRLASAIVLTLAASLFIYLYPLCYLSRFHVEHPEASFAPMAEFFVRYPWWGFILPVCAVIVGLLSFSVKHGSAEAVEKVVTSAWLLSLLAVGGTVLACQLMTAPSFNHMQWHF